MLTENISTGLILSRKSIIPVTASSVTWIKIDIITGQNMAFFEPMFCFPRIKPGFFPMDVIPFRLLWLTLLASSSASSTYFHIYAYGASSLPPRYPLNSKRYNLVNNHIRHWLQNQQHDGCAIPYQRKIFSSGAPSGRSRRLLTITQPPACYTA